MAPARPERQPLQRPGKTGCCPCRPRLLAGGSLSAWILPGEGRLPILRYQGHTGLLGVKTSTLNSTREPSGTQGRAQSTSVTLSLASFICQDTGKELQVKGLCSVGPWPFAYDHSGHPKAPPGAHPPPRRTSKTGSFKASHPAQLMQLGYWFRVSPAVASPGLAAPDGPGAQAKRPLGFLKIRTSSREQPKGKVQRPRQEERCSIATQALPHIGSLGLQPFV